MTLPFNFCRLLARTPVFAGPALVCCSLVMSPISISAQSFTGSTLSTMSGALLGAYSGVTLGLLGTMMPCNRTTQGSRCAGSAASAGAALGIAMGGLIGAQNQDHLRTRYEQAGIGAVVGAVVGVGLRRGVRQYGWTDVGMSSLLGAAIGAAPEGAGIGAAIGATAGGIVWLAFPDAGLPDFLALTLAGVAVGGLYDWASGAANAKVEPTFGPSFSIPVR